MNRKNVLNSRSVRKTGYWKPCTPDGVSAISIHHNKKIYHSNPQPKMFTRTKYSTWSLYSQSVPLQSSWPCLCTICFTKQLVRNTTRTTPINLVMLRPVQGTISIVGVEKLQKIWHILSSGYFIFGNQKCPSLTFSTLCVFIANIYYTPSHHMTFCRTPHDHMVRPLITWLLPHP